MHLFLELCRKSNCVWLHALVQSDCLYSSLFFEHYNRILFATECSDLVFVWGHVHATILSYCTWPWPGLDSVSYSGCSMVPSVTR